MGHRGAGYGSRRACRLRAAAEKRFCSTEPQCPCAVKRPWFRSRGGSVVFVDQSTQAILPRHSAHRQRRHRGLAARRPLVQPLVWPCLLVVLNELLEHEL